MSENLSIKKLLEAGLAFTQLTQTKAEELVGELVKLGQVQADDVTKRVESLMAESRDNVSRLVDLVRNEVASQLRSYGLIPQEAPAPPPPAPAPAAAAAKKAAPRKAAPRKAAPRKAVAPVKKAAQ